MANGEQERENTEETVDSTETKRNLEDLEPADEDADRVSGGAKHADPFSGPLE
jgi:hypothetical protein